MLPLFWALSNVLLAGLHCRGSILNADAPVPSPFHIYVCYLSTYMLYVYSRYIFCILSGKRKKTGGKEKKESLYIYDLRSGLDSLVVMTDN